MRHEKRWMFGIHSRGGSLAAVVGFALAFACSFGLASCATTVDEVLHEPARQDTPQAAGDEALPPLDGEYAYTLVEIVSKDAEANSLEVRALAWEIDGSFTKSEISVGETGAVSCTNLVLFPAGIPDGHAVVVASPVDDAASFPIVAYSIEKPSWFEARLARSDTARL